MYTIKVTLPNQAISEIARNNLRSAFGTARIWATSRGFLTDLLWSGTPAQFLAEDGVEPFEAEGGTVWCYPEDLESCRERLAAGEVASVESWPEPLSFNCSGSVPLLACSEHQLDMNIEGAPILGVYLPNS